MDQRACQADGRLCGKSFPEDPHRESLLSLQWAGAFKLGQATGGVYCQKLQVGSGF